MKMRAHCTEAGGLWAPVLCVLLVLAALSATSCTGPGLEPPNADSNGTTGSVGTDKGKLDGGADDFGNTSGTGGTSRTPPTEKPPIPSTDGGMVSPPADGSDDEDAGAP